MGSLFQDLNRTGKKVYKNLLKTVMKHIGKKEHKSHFTDFIKQEFKKNINSEKPQKLKLAHNYTTYINSVHHHKQNLKGLWRLKSSTVFAMKVDELCSTVVGAEDIDALHSKNKALHARLAIVEDARAQAVFKITKSETTQKVCAQASKKAELQLKVFEDMFHAKHKELTKALAELLKANGLLANLGVLGYADPKDSRT
ncbi:Uncharacterized protein Fot_35543 [Forsythia ovata]|uniref:Uncharacterized protein n=1 Tax=Forsythia ovata TaxID=205694 RepID=A0ABD1SLU4_9LAMI